MLYIHELSVTYSLLETDVVDEELRAKNTYGIAAFDSEGNVLLERKDICLNKADMKDFIKNLNEHDASIHHIDDLIEDFLGI